MDKTIFAKFASNAVDTVKTGTGKFTEGIAYAISHLHPAVTGTVSFVVAALTLVFIAVIGYVIYYILTTAHPRIPWFSVVQDNDKIDNTIASSVAEALASYYLGVNIAYKDYRNSRALADSDATKEVLDNIVYNKINFHQYDRSYDWLYTIVEQGSKYNSKLQDALNNIRSPADYTKAFNQLVTLFTNLIKFIYTEEVKQGNDRNHIDSNLAFDLYGFLTDEGVRNQMQSNIGYLKKHNLFNFVDYSAYDPTGIINDPSQDKTLQMYGKYAQLQGVKIHDVSNYHGPNHTPQPQYTGPYTIETLLNITNRDVKQYTKYDPDRLKDMTLSLTSNTSNTCSDALFGNSFSTSSCYKTLFPADGSEVPGNPKKCKTTGYKTTGAISFIVDVREAIIDALKIKGGENDCVYVPDIANNDENFWTVRSKNVGTYKPVYSALKNMDAEFAALNKNIGNGMFKILGEPNNPRYGEAVNILHTVQKEMFYDFQTLLNIQCDFGNGDQPVLDTYIIEGFMAQYVDMVSLLQYEYYKDTINNAIFLSLYLNNTQPLNMQTTLQNISNLYRSFGEIYLFKEYDKLQSDAKFWKHLSGHQLKEIYEKYIFKPTWETYIVHGLWEDTWLSWFSSDGWDYTSWYWDAAYKIFTNPGTFLGPRFDNGNRPSNPPNTPAFKSTFGWVPPSESNEAPAIVFAEDKPHRSHELFGGEETMTTDVKGKEKVIEPLFVYDFDPIEVIMAIPEIAILVMGVVFLTDAGFAFDCILWLFKAILFITVFCLMSVLNIGAPYSIGHILLFIVYKLLMLVVSVLMSAVNIGLFCLILSFAYIGSIIDSIYGNGLVSRWIYRNFFACENSPLAWHTMGSYQNVNKNMLKYGMCWMACAEGYEPDGLSCAKLPNYMPRKCPQALIMEIAKGNTIYSPYALSNGVPLDMGDMKETEKMKLIQEIKEQKAGYFADCQKTMEPFDDITKNICKSSHLVSKTKSDNDILDAVCEAAYCTNGNMEPFCYKYSKNAKETAAAAQDQSLYKQMLVYVCIIVVVMCMLIVLARGNKGFGEFTIKPLLRNMGSSINKVGTNAAP